MANTDKNYMQACEINIKGDNKMDNRQRLRNIIESAKASRRYCKQEMIRAYKNVCVYGLGKLFEDTFEDRRIAEHFHVNYLSDRSSAKQFVWGGYSGIQYVLPEKLREIDDLIVIIMIRDSMELERQFLNWGIPFVTGFELLVEMSLGKIVTSDYFSKNRILEVYDLLEPEAKETYVELMANRLAPEFAEKNYCDLYSPNAYFNKVFFPVSEENFVDCGAYDGDTIRELLRTDQKIKRIYSFEIDNENYKHLNKWVHTLPTGIQKKIKLYHAGVWNEHKMLSYGNEAKSDNGSYSILKCSNVKRVFAERLDDVLKGETITFIKMDVEGSELPALQGSERIIKTQKPKLAICLYHKIEDFWEIPMYLHSLVPEYHFGILHHSENIFYESVLYAWTADI